MRTQPNIQRILLAAAALTLAHAANAAPRDPRFPDWPCQQLKVPQLSAGSIWTGPPIDQLDRKRPRAADESDIVQRIAARRTSMDQARKLIGTFVVGPPDVRQRKAQSLFSDLFDTLNAQRTSVMEGIERFSRREKSLAEAIRRDLSRMRELQDGPSPEDAKLVDLGKQIEWNTRVFEDRQKSTTYVCEVPTIIERRLYELTQIIQQAAN